MHSWITKLTGNFENRKTREWAIMAIVVVGMIHVVWTPLEKWAGLPGITPYAVVLYAIVAIAMLHALFDDVGRIVENSDFEFIQGSDQVYHQLSAATRSAKQIIRTTHLRNRPLGHMTQHASGSYNVELFHWLAQDRRKRKLQRVISTSMTQGQLQHALPLLLISEIETECNIAGIDWPLTTPAINLVILDDNLVFICFYDNPDQVPNQAPLYSGADLHAIKVTSRNCVQKWIEYFNSLFDDARAIRNTNHSSELRQRLAQLYVNSSESDKAAAWKAIDSVSADRKLVAGWEQVFSSSVDEFEKDFPRPAN